LLFDRELWGCEPTAPTKYITKIRRGSQSTTSIYLPIYKGTSPFRYRTLLVQRSYPSQKTILMLSLYAILQQRDIMCKFAFPFTKSRHLLIKEKNLNLINKSFTGRAFWSRTFKSWILGHEVARRECFAHTVTVIISLLTWPILFFFANFPHFLFFW
jgi:hypothetical protein